MLILSYSKGSPVFRNTHFKKMGIGNNSVDGLVCIEINPPDRAVHIDIVCEALKGADDLFFRIDSIWHRIVEVRSLKADAGSGVLSKGLGRKGR